MKKLWKLLGLGIGWLFGILFVMMGLSTLSTNFLLGVFFLLFGLFILPLRRILLAKMGVRLKKPVSLLIGLVLFLGAVFTSNSSSDASIEVHEPTVEYESVLAEEQRFLEETFEVETTEGKENKEDVADNTITVDTTKDSSVSKEFTQNETQSRTDVKEETKKEVYSQLSVHFIDVGQADATLFICDGEAMLVDAGNDSDGTKLQLYLSKQEVKNLKYFIATHPDSDHIGGADVIITKFPVETVFMSSYKKDTRTYEDVINALEYKRVSWSTPKVGSTYSLGGATFTVLAPNKSYDDPNEASIALLLSHGENTFLFTGDGETEAEADILKNGLSIDCDVLKAGHHGSKTSNSKAFLEKATPEYVVVSCGEGNSYGHPHAAAMNNFRSLGAKLFRTDEQGTIVASSDGKEITWNLPPTDSWKAGEPTENSSSKSNSSKSSSSSSSKEVSTEKAQDTVSVVTPAPQEAPQVESQPEPQPAPQPAPSSNPSSSGGFAVNNKNGKIHIVGACTATEPGHKQAMKEPVYFNTFEEAEAYSIQTHPEEPDRTCGRCW